MFCKHTIQKNSEDSFGRLNPLTLSLRLGSPVLLREQHRHAFSCPQAKQRKNGVRLIVSIID